MIWSARSREYLPKQSVEQATNTGPLRSVVGMESRDPQYPDMGRRRYTQAPAALQEQIRRASFPDGAWERWKIELPPPLTGAIMPARQSIAYGGPHGIPHVSRSAGALGRHPGQRPASAGPGRGR